jgi:hypothetical protein
MKQKLGETICTYKCNSNKGSGLAWCGIVVRKLRGKRRGEGKGKYCLRKEEKNTVHILLKCEDSEVARKIF